MWKSGEKSIQFWGKIRKKFIEMWKWAQKKVASLHIYQDIGKLGG